MTQFDNFYDNLIRANGPVYLHTAKDQGIEVKRKWLGKILALFTGKKNQAWNFSSNIKTLNTLIQKTIETEFAKDLTPEEKKNKIDEWKAKLFQIQTKLDPNIKKYNKRHRECNVEIINPDLLKQYQPPITTSTHQPLFATAPTSTQPQNNDVEIINPDLLEQYQPPITTSTHQLHSTIEQTLEQLQNTIEEIPLKLRSEAVCSLKSEAEAIAESAKSENSVEKLQAIEKIISGLQEQFIALKISSELVSYLSTIESFINSYTNSDTATRLQEYCLHILNHERSSRKVLEHLGTLIFLLDHDPDVVVMLSGKTNEQLFAQSKGRARKLLEQKLTTTLTNLSKENDVYPKDDQRAYKSVDKANRREIKLSQMIADCLVTSTGVCNRGCIPLIKKICLSQSLHNQPFEKHVLAILKELQHTYELQHVFDTIVPPDPTNRGGALAIKTLLSIPPETILTDVHAKKAAIATLFKRSRQGEQKTCHVASFAIQTSYNKPAKQLEDIKDIIKTGALQREKRGQQVWYMADPTTYSAASDITIIISQDIKPLLTTTPRMLSAINIIGISEKELSQIVDKIIYDNIGKSFTFDEVISKIVESHFEEIEQQVRIYSVVGTPLEYIKNAYSNSGIDTHLLACALEELTVHYGKLVNDMSIDELKTELLRIIRKQALANARFAFAGFSDQPLSRLWENCLSGMSTGTEIHYRKEFVDQVTDILSINTNLNPEEKMLLQAHLTQWANNHMRYTYSINYLNKGERNILWYLTENQEICKVESSIEFYQLIKELIVYINNISDSDLTKKLRGIVEPPENFLTKIIESYSTRYHGIRELFPWALPPIGGSTHDIFRIYWQQNILLEKETIPEKDMIKEDIDETFEKISTIAAECRNKMSIGFSELRIPISTTGYHAYSFLPFHDSLVHYQESGTNFVERKQKLQENATKFYSEIVITDKMLNNFLSLMKTSRSARMCNEIPITDVSLTEEETKQMNNGQVTLADILAHRIRKKSPSQLNILIEELKEFSTKLVDPLKKQFLLTANALVLNFLANNSIQTGWDKFAQKNLIRYADTNYLDAFSPRMNLHYCFAIAPMDNSLLYLRINEVQKNIQIEGRKEEHIALLSPEMLAQFDITHKVNAEKAYKLEKKIERLEKEFRQKLEEYKERAQQVDSSAVQQFEKLLLAAQALPQNRDEEGYYEALCQHIDTELEKISSALVEIQIRDKKPQEFLKEQENMLMELVKDEKVRKEIVDTFTQLEALVATHEPKAVLQLALAYVDRYKVECTCIEARKKLFDLAAELQTTLQDQMKLDVPVEIPGPMQFTQYFNEEEISPEKPVEELTILLEAMDPQAYTRAQIMRSYTRQIEKRVKNAQRLLKKAEKYRKTELKQELKALTDGTKNPMRTLSELRDHFRNAQALLDKCKKLSNETAASM